MIQFGILGPLEVRADGERVSLGGPRQRAVLARLLLDPGRVVSSDLLIEDVWDGRPPASAGKVLQKYVSGLRKVLPAPVLRTRVGGYVLDIDEDTLDAHRFERLLHDHEFTPALALWRGDVLADLSGLAFVAPERARLDELRLFAIESRIEAEVEGGRHGAVIAGLAELVDAYPLRERLIGLLMLSLYRSGRQVEALRVFDRHRRQLAEDVGLDPAAALRDLEAAILRHDPGLGPPIPSLVCEPRSKGNLPRQLTSFVGREDELDALCRAIAEHRLVTLTGPGGVGKTRVALELGSRIDDRFPGGVWLVDLAGVQHAECVADAVATPFDVDTRDAPDDTTAVAAALAHRPPPLVILDNCEHLVDAAAAVTVAVLARTEGVRIVATSRRPLGVDGEFVRPLAPLPDDDAARLFSDRARLAIGAGKEVGDDEALAICGRLDGLPLAIELAASQLRVLDPVEITGRLGDQLALRSSSLGAARRQRSLGEMIQWSYDLLAPEVRSTFARLGVFGSSLTLAAAESVCAVGETTTRDVLWHITTLVDHSLLVRDSTPAPASRYRILETLRLFALARLDEQGLVDQTARAHAGYFCGMAEAGSPEMYGPEEVSWRTRLDLEDANMQVAMAWADEHDLVLALRLAVARWPYSEVRWRERQSVARLERLLRHPVDVPAELHAWALTALAVMAGNPGDARSAIPYAFEAVAAFRNIGIDQGLAVALGALGAALGNQGSLVEAEAAVAEGLTLAERVDDARITARLLEVASFIARRRGDHERAAEYGREELATWRQIGSRRGEATALRHVAISLQHLGAADEATRLCNQALEIWEELDDAAAIAHVETTLADIARMNGDLAGAVPRYDTALINLREIGDRRCTASTFKNLAVIAAQNGEQRRAADLYRQGLTLRFELGDEAGLAEVLEGLAGVHSAERRDDCAVALIAAAETLRERTGSTASPHDAEVVAQSLDLCRHRLGAERFDASYERGRLMSVTEIVEFALR